MWYYVLEKERMRIIVDVPNSDDKVVTLILNDVNVKCSDSAAIYVKNAKKVVLSLVEGTTNTFTDGNNYSYEDEAKEEPSACIFSKDDLVYILENSKSTLSFVDCIDWINHLKNIIIVEL